MGKWERSIWIIAVVLLTGALLGGGIGARCDANGSTDESIELLMDVYNIIQKNYVDKPKAEQLAEGAIKGMLKSLDDEHSYFMPKQQYQDFQSDIKGKFFGVGIEITMKGDTLTIVSPIEGTPGYRAGLKPRDQIIKIDGKSTKDMSMMDAVHNIRGKKGTPVVLTINRPAMDEPFDVEIIRDEIKIRSLEWKMIDDDIAYIRLKSFRMNAAKEMRSTLTKVFAQKAKGIIFDLRGNPGGLLQAAIQISDFFLNQGTIVSTKGRKEAHEIVHRAHQQNTLLGGDIPMFVLINDGSASASEIVAGALKDNKRATIYGTNSFGKASVQKLFRMPNGGAAIRLTIARYYTPSGKMIHDNGIQPDVTIKPMTFRKEDKDGLKKMLKQKLLRKFLKGHPNAHYNDKTINEFHNFLKRKGVEISSITARYLLKREMTLKSPLYDLEFDNQLRRAIKDMKGKL
jgi:carboxyl-terminal processing protease